MAFNVYSRSCRAASGALASSATVGLARRNPRKSTKLVSSDVPTERLPPHLPMAPRRAAAGHLSVDTSGSAAPGPSSALTSASTEGGGGGLSPATENSEDAGAVAKGLSLDSGSDEDEDGSGKRKSGGTNLGRRKIDIEYIEVSLAWKWLSSDQI